MSPLTVVNKGSLLTVVKKRSFSNTIVFRFLTTTNDDPSLTIVNGDTSFFGLKIRGQKKFRLFVLIKKTFQTTYTYNLIFIKKKLKLIVINSD